MKSIKKFSAMSAKDQPITESAKVTKEAVDELIKKISAKIGNESKFTSFLLKYISSIAIESFFSTGELYLNIITSPSLKVQFSAELSEFT